MRMCLTHVIYGCTFMTYGPRQRSAESRAAKSCPRPTTAGGSTACGGRALGARLFYFVPTSLSVPAASATAETAGSRERAQAGVYSEASTQLDSTSAVVRICQKEFDQRSREPGVISAPATRGRAWLSRDPSRPALFSGNIDLTACGRTSWRRLTSYWCPTGGGRWREPPPNHGMLIRR